MKKIQFILTLSLLGILVFSCDNNFEEINQDPNSATAVPSDLLIADAVFNAGNIIHSTFRAGDMGATWAQLWSKVQYNDESRYTPRESVIEGTWLTMYEDLISDSRAMEVLAIAEGNEYSQAVALILQSYGYLFMTDVYGDIPNTEAIGADVSNFTPAYDAQEVVYDSAFARLDRAYTLLTTGSGSINASADIIYGGDAVKWAKFANSLTIRALMRISGVTDVSASLQSALGRMMFTSNDDNASVKYLAAQPNAHPFYETIVFGSRFEWKVSDVLVSTLESLDDPRLTVMAAENADGAIRGKPVGFSNLPNEDYNYENVSGIGELYLDAELPGVFLSYSELMFLLAEAAVEGYVTGDPTSYYNAGIAASMDENGIVSGVDAYIAASATLSSDASTALEQIAIQKWLGLFAQGVEAWTEYRRTGFPVLTPAIEGVLNEIPSRWTYPLSEQTNNLTSYEAAVASQGPNLLTTKIWWDVN